MAITHDNYLHNLNSNKNNSTKIVEYPLCKLD